MCGIAGILNPHPTSCTAELEALRAALRHRGPDDDGIWLSPSGHAGLAHTRLAIIDLSSGGHQPMVIGDHVIVFNGEIYNFRELRSELEAAGVELHSQSDTEVLLQLYRREGATMLARLRGMFALAIWNERERTGFLARDAFGIKPLYYSLLNGRLAFASEVRALRTSGLASDTPDAAAIQRYLESGSVTEPNTLLRDVRCLAAGHCLTWKNGVVREQTWWQPTFSPQPMTANEAVERTRVALVDSIRSHLVSDVPVGLFLSGGIDSTLLAALIKTEGFGRLESFSIGVDSAHLDESDTATLTATHFGLNHHLMKLDAAGMGAQFSDFLACQDQPSIDGFNSFVVAGFARKHGMKVVLSGLGGDEFFGGYVSFQAAPRLARMAGLAHLLPGLRMLGRYMEKAPIQHRLQRIGDLLQRQPTLAEAWRVYRGIFPRNQARRLAAKFAGCAEADLPRGELPSTPHAMDEHDQVSWLEATGYMRNQLLKDSDVMSMAHGLELRVPLVDRVLFKAISVIPAALRLQPGKRMLLEAVPEIPPWVANMPKRGFLFPYQEWLAADWGGAFDKARQELRDPKAPWYQIWCVFMLRHWLGI